MTMTIWMGSTPFRTLDGESTTADQVIQEALAEWNRVGVGRGPDHGFFQWRVAPVNPNCLRDGTNIVTMSATLCGQQWGDALGVTQRWVSSGRTEQADVVFNSTVVWNRYRGPMRFGAVNDLYRVALHEFGHVAGLYHSGDPTALMWSHAGNTDSLQPDDVAGVHAVPYGTLPVTITGVIADRSPPQAAGTRITFTALSAGGVAPVEYKWWLWDGRQWALAQNWSVSPTFSWIPATANPSYVVAVWARSAGNTADIYERLEATGFLAFPIAGTGAPLAITGVTADRSPPQPAGTRVTFTAAATGGTAPVQYKWWLYNGSQWTLAQNWSTSNTFVWTPATANPAYVVAVWARSAGNTADIYERLEATGFLAFPIAGTGAPLAITGVTADRSPPQPAGTRVTFTAAATGGTAPVQYKWWLYNGSQWTLAQNWSTSNTFVWTPATANPAYVVAVWARSAGNTADIYERLEATGFLAFPITAPSAPDILGLYQGFGLHTQTGCVSSFDNGTFSTAVAINVTTQAPSGFSGGVAYATASSLALGSLGGSLSASGDISGSYSVDVYDLFFNVYVKSSSGTFSGRASGTQLTLAYSGRDTIGDRCSFSGSATLSR